MRTRAAARLAWSLWAITVVLTALLGLFYLLSLSAWGEIPIGPRPGSSR